MRTSGYCPQSNELTEQKQLHHKKYLTIYLDEGNDKDDWNTLLKQSSYIRPPTIPELN